MLSMMLMERESHPQKGPITLTASSAQRIAEFFDYSINSILYQRELYPPEDFTMQKKYGISLLKTNSPSLQLYISRILEQVQVWIEMGSISRLVIVISRKADRVVVERWQFDIACTSLIPASASTPSIHHQSQIAPKSIQEAEGKPDREIQSEIAAIIRQITASVSFLPILTDACTFNVLAYTDNNVQVPGSWIDSDPRVIDSHAEQVKLRSFSTTTHSVDTLVAYKIRVDDE